MTQSMPADPWAHRTEEMRCRTCMWYVEKASGIGRCRRHAPSMGGYPVVKEADWCGDHRLDEAVLTRGRQERLADADAQMKDAAIQFALHERKNIIATSPVKDDTIYVKHDIIRRLEQQAQEIVEQGATTFSEIIEQQVSDAPNEETPGDKIIVNWRELMVPVMRPIPFTDRLPSYDGDCNKRQQVWVGHWNDSFDLNRWIWNLVPLDMLRVWRESSRITHFIPGFAKVLPTTLFNPLDKEDRE